jgi:hypothetical protein
MPDKARLILLLRFTTQYCACFIRAHYKTTLSMLQMLARYNASLQKFNKLNSRGYRR